MRTYKFIYHCKITTFFAIFASCVSAAAHPHLCDPDSRPEDGRDDETILRSCLNFDYQECYERFLADAV